MNKIKLNDKEFTFHVVGKGQPLILIAGLGTDRTIWDFVIKKLTDKFQIILFDNLGAGENNEFEAPTDTLSMAKCVLEIMDSLNLKSAHIAGHSLGSYVAQMIAAHYPTRLDNLILISTRAKSSPNTVLHYEVIKKLVAAGVSRDVLICDSVSWLYSCNYLNNLNKANELIEKIKSKSPAVNFNNLCNQMTAAMDHDISIKINNITAKTLILNGDQDLICTPSEAYSIHNQIKNSSFVKINNAGHMLLIETSDEVAMQINKFCLDKNLNETKNS